MGKGKDVTRGCLMSAIAAVLGLIFLMALLPAAIGGVWAGLLAPITGQWAFVVIGPIAALLAFGCWRLVRHILEERRRIGLSDTTCHRCGGALPNGLPAGLANNEPLCSECLTMLETGGMKRETPKH